MNRRYAVSGVALVGVVLCAAGSALAQERGGIVVSDGWSRATPVGAKVAGGYLTITNKGAEPDTLTGVTSDVSRRSEVHEMAVKDGIMSMRELPVGLEIAPGKSVVLKPGSYHLMFQELNAPLTTGQTFPVTLAFRKAGTITATLTVGTIAASGPAGTDMHGGMAPGMKTGH